MSMTTLRFKSALPAIPALALLLAAVLGQMVFGQSALAAAQPAKTADAAKPAAPASTTQWLDESGDVPYALTGTLAAGKNTAATIVLQASETAKVVLRLSNGEAQFLASENGKMVPVGAVGKLSVLGSGSCTFTVDRTTWELVFIAGNEVICRGYSFAPDSEKVGWDGGAALSDLRVQPLGEIAFADDFTRIVHDNTVGTWEPAHGKWEQKALRSDVQAAAMDASKSTNPFSYFGQPTDDQPAISVNGYWFWRNYMVSAAVRGFPDSVMGVVSCYQDTKNYIAVEWHSIIADKDPNVIRLVVVQDGKRHVLSQARGGFLPGMWYRLGLGYSDGRVVAVVDGVVRLSADTEAMGQGECGVLTAGKGGAFFDDVRCDDWSMFRDDFPKFEPGRWAQHGGTWHVANHSMILDSTGAAYAATGEPTWSNYDVSVDMKGSASSAGLMLDAEGKNPVLIAWRSGSTPSLAVLSGKEGGKSWQQLVSAPCAKLTDKPLRLDISVEDGLITASLGKASVQTFVPYCDGGRLALYSRDAKNLAFSDVALNFIPPPQTSHTTKEFTNIKVHFEMVEWASRRHGWEPAALAVPGGADNKALAGEWWTKGDYHGHYDVDFPLNGIGTRDFTMSLVLNGDPGAPDVGVGITISGKKGEKSLHFAVKSAGKVVAEQDYTPANADTTIRCSRLGEFIVITVGNDCIFHRRLLNANGEAVASAKPAGEEKPK